MEEPETHRGRGKAPSRRLGRSGVTAACSTPRTCPYQLWRWERQWTQHLAPLPPGWCASGPAAAEGGGGEDAVGKTGQGGRGRKGGTDWWAAAGTAHRHGAQCVSLVVVLSVSQGDLRQRGDRVLGRFLGALYTGTGHHHHSHDHDNHRPKQKTKTTTDFHLLPRWPLPYCLVQALFVQLLCARVNLCQRKR